MKLKKILYPLSLLITLLFGACESNLLEHQNSFEASQKVWLDFKNSSDNSYTYRATEGTWAGSSWTTIITVVRGEVTRRNFSYDIFQGIAKPSSGWDEQSRQDILESMVITSGEFEEAHGNTISSLLEWEEEGEGLGVHQLTGAAEILTLDEIYSKTATDWLVARENGETFFEAKNNGMISLAGYVPNNCQDDCFIGIGIVEIEQL